MNECDFVTSFYGDKLSYHLLLVRLLCKLPGTEEDPNSREVPWHQDSQYWPLEPMKVGRTFSASCKKMILMNLQNLSILTKGGYQIIKMEI